MITDGTVWCTWCMEDRTYCNLCGGLSELAGLTSVSEENRRRQFLRQQFQEDELRVIGK